MAAILWATTASAAEPLRSSDGARILAWPHGTTLEVCPPAASDALLVRALEGVLLWWTEGGLTVGVELATAPCPIAPGDVRTTLHIADAISGWPQAYGHVETVVAFTVHTFDADSGTLLDADVALNGVGFAFTDGGTDADPAHLDLGYVVAHEFGHVLGLGHPCGDAGASLTSCFGLPNATEARLSAALMFPSTPLGPRELHLSEDDLQGARAFLAASGAPASGALYCTRGDALELVAPMAGALVESLPEGTVEYPRLALLSLADGRRHASVLDMAPGDCASGAAACACRAMGPTPRIAPRGPWWLLVVIAVGVRRARQERRTGR